MVDDYAVTTEGSPITVRLACATTDAHDVVRRRTAGIGWDIAVSVGVTPPGQVIGTLTGNHVRVRPRPSGYAPGRTLFSPSLVGDLSAASDGTTAFTYRIAPGVGMGLRWLLAAMGTLFWLVALASWAVPVALLATFFTVMFLVFTFLERITRTEADADDRALAGWVDGVVKECREAGTHGLPPSDRHP